MVSPELVDPYLIPGTSVLRNLVGAISTPGLAVAEADLSFARALQSLDSPVAAQRIFWNRISLEAGRQLDWRPVHGEENHSAARAGSDQQDLEPLIRMFDKIVTLPHGVGTEEWPTQEIRRLSIAPSEDG